MDFLTNVQLSNQIVTERLGDEGDSGCLAVEKTSGRPVGLLIAKTKSQQTGDPLLTVVSPIGAVFEKLPGFSLILPGTVL